MKYGARGSPITVEFAEGNEDVTVSVHNEGEPIPVDQQGRIFDFLTTASGSGHAEPDSWGIGLTLVKTVVDAHNGDVRIESSASLGTTFTIRLEKRPRPPGQMRARVNPGVDR